MHIAPLLLRQGLREVITEVREPLIYSPPRAVEGPAEDDVAVVAGEGAVDLDDLGAAEAEGRIDAQQAARGLAAAGDDVVHFVQLGEDAGGVHQVDLAFAGQADLARGAQGVSVGARITVAGPGSSPPSRPSPAFRPPAPFHRRRIVGCGWGLPWRGLVLPA